MKLLSVVTSPSIYHYDPHVFILKKQPVNNFTTDSMKSKFEVFSNNKMDALYLTETIRTYWIKTLDKYWYEGDTP